MIYFGTRLSENIFRREPEGYLICLNVPVARTGTQDYLPSELGLPEPDSRLVPVLRPEEEVFAPACLASFEGMPVTDNHPSDPDGVNTENIRALQKGHAHNVRRGPPPDDDLLLADLIITAPRLIEEILAGKREISCGYNYVLCRESGAYVQREIRGNHVAVVDAGRAGPRVSIRDRRTPAPGIPVFPINPKTPENERSRSMSRKNSWRAKLMTRLAKDGDLETLSEMIEEITGEEPVPEPLQPAPEPAEPPVVVDPPEDQPVLVDCGPEILAALNRIIELLSGPAGADCGGSCRQGDEDPAPSGEPAAEAAAEQAAESVAEAAAEAAAEVLAAAEETAEASGDPVDELVAGILEGEGTPDPAIPGDPLSGILEPEEAADSEDPETPEEDPPRAADALRSALAVFRPQLQRMSSADRKRFIADVSERMRRLTGRATEASGPYAALRRAASRDRSARSLGEKIMSERNVNRRK